MDLGAGPGRMPRETDLQSTTEITTGWRMRWIRVVVGVLAATLLASCGGSDSDDNDDAGASAPNAGEIAADKRVDIALGRASGRFSLGIYAMNADGSDLTRLTDDPDAADTDPAFSRDGALIAFTRHEGKTSDIYVMNADGSDLTNLTDSPDTGDGAPAFSPDGQKIAFDSNRDSPRPRGGPSLIYVMNADGTDATRLTDGPDDSQPAWSPDGERIAFYRERPLEGDPSAAEGGIYVINADGSREGNLTGGPDFDGVIPTSPTFSPDGELIAFLGLRVGDRAPLVWMMNADGTEPAPLRGARSAPFSSPTFSPDGERIAFVGHVSPGIYVMNADGSDQTPLTKNVPNDSRPAWSPASDASP